ncbi:MAG: class E sortase [Acidimicrobiia bacterium]|nr:class E sortase [Acidimicrobiia bacterium]
MSTVEAPAVVQVVRVRPPEQKPVEPAPVAPRSHSVRGAVTRSLKILGGLVLGFVLFLFVMTPLVHGRTQRSLEQSFRTELGFAQAPLGGAIKQGSAVAVLQIPEIGVHEVVIEGTSASMLKRGPGHLRTSPLPGQPGNSVVAGRRASYGGPFLHLDRLHRGDTIRVTTGQGLSIFVVQRVGTVSPGHADPIGPTRDSRITLVTSDPVFAASRRLVAVATLQGDPWAQPDGRPTQLHTDELGLQGQPGAAGRVLFWGGVLIVAGIASVWLLRRWPGQVAYVLIAPVMLLLLVLLYDSFAGVLPATL